MAKIKEIFPCYGGVFHPKHKGGMHTDFLECYQCFGEVSLFDIKGRIPHGARATLEICPHCGATPDSEYHKASPWPKRDLFLVSNQGKKITRIPREVIEECLTRSRRSDGLSATK